MQSCYFVKGFSGERVLIPGCWSALMDGRESCTCPRDRTTMECLEERVAELERTLKLSLSETKP